MKRTLPWALLVATVVVFAAFAYLLTTYMPGAGPLVVFSDAALIPKAIMAVCLLMAVAGLVFLATGKSGRPLKMIAIAGPVLGLLGLAFTALNIFMAISEIGSVPFAIQAPGWVEALFLLGLAGLAGCIGAFGWARSEARPA